MKDLLEFIQKQYDEYIDKINAQKDDDPKFFRASSAGQCFRKHFYRKFNAEKTERNSTSKRLLRLGDLVHEDIQNSLKNVYASEFKMIHPKYPIKGHVDLIRINDNYVEIIDIKTISNWNWKQKFGKDSEENINHYEFQINTYRYLAKEILDVPYNNIKAYLVYYNKDRSTMQIVEAMYYIIDEVESYWEKLMEYNKKIKTIEDIEMIKLDEGYAPYFTWECNEKYCPYYKICKGDVR